MCTFAGYGLARIENPRTGEQIEFDASDPEVQVILALDTAGHRAAEHVHPKMEERLEVMEGRAAFLVACRQIAAVAGETVIVPPGVERLACNPTDEAVRLCIQMRPSLHCEEFTRRLFAGEPTQELLSEFAPEIVLPRG